MPSGYVFSIPLLLSLCAEILKEDGEVALCRRVAEIGNIAYLDDNLEIVDDAERPTVCLTGLVRLEGDFAETAVAAIKSAVPGSFDIDRSRRSMSGCGRGVEPPPPRNAGAFLSTAGWRKPGNGKGSAVLRPLPVSRSGLGAGNDRVRPRRDASSGFTASIDRTVPRLDSLRKVNCPARHITGTAPSLSQSWACAFRGKP